MTRTPEPQYVRPPRRIPLAFLILLLFAFLLLLLVIPSNADVLADDAPDPDRLPPEDSDDDGTSPATPSTTHTPGHGACRRAA